MAAEAGLLQPLYSRSIQHRVFLYVEDVVMFLRPSESDIVVEVVLRYFHRHYYKSSPLWFVVEGTKALV
jgi:hypothetical protein